MIAPKHGGGARRRRFGVRRALITSCLLLIVGVSVSGCIVEPVHGWCYYHPYRCR